MPHISTTLNASVLIQDTSGATPVTRITQAKTDQETDHDEFQALEVTVPAGATNQAVNLTNLDVRALYMETSQPLTVRVGIITNAAEPFRSLMVMTFDTGESPADLFFNNAGATDAQVFIALGSKNP